jgi:hypothetical protein
MFTKIAARTAAIALCVSVAGAVAPLSASAGTPACGPNCLGVFSDELGTYAAPNFVEHVFGGVARIGTETGLTTASNTDTSEDFINPHPGDVSDYYKLGLVSAAVDSHYQGLTASQLEYAPGGMPTGLCVGIPTSPFRGEPLSLQSCTVPGRTVWIIGTSLSPSTAAQHIFPIVSGATQDFSHPFAMTYPRHVNTNRMLPPIRLDHLRFHGAAQSVPADQLWGVEFGPLSQ